MEQNQPNSQQTNQIKNIAVIEPKTDSMIHDAQYDYYGKKLAVCTSDGQITIYNVSEPENVQRLATFQAHNGPIWQICWGHPRFGNILASCGFDKKVAIWKEFKQNEWKEIISHKEHSGSVNGIAWVPWELGLQLAACSSDGQVSILARKNDDTWEKIIKMEAHEMGVNAITWAPLTYQEDFYAEQQNIDSKSQCKFATASCDNTIKIWLYNSQNREFQLVQQYQDHSEWVRDIAWNPNMGALNDIVASCSDDQTVIIRKLDRKTSQIIESKILKLDGPVWHISWSLQGNMLSVSYATNDSDNICKIFSENVQGDWNLVDTSDDQSNEQQQTS